MTVMLWRVIEGSWLFKLDYFIKVKLFLVAITDTNAVMYLYQKTSKLMQYH